MKFFALALLMTSASAGLVKKDLHLHNLAQAKANTKSFTKASISSEAKLRAALKTGMCEDGEGVDSFGDGCDWYDDNESGCGNYDTEDFSAADECCACGGGEDGDCADGDGVDSFGDGCDWYDANPSGCGSYDTADFVAEDECCAC